MSNSKGRSINGKNSVCERERDRERANVCQIGV